jgi:glycosyltransferase involved in cell wall biosynthesis
MKITIVLGAFFPVPPVMGGAVEKVWLALAREFVRHGHEVTLISRAFATLPKTEMLDGVRHLRVKGFDSPASLLWLKILDLIYSWRVRSILKPADLIVTNTFWLPILLRNARYGALYVHVARFPKRQMRLYRHAARLQTPSNDVARAIEKEVPDRAERIRVIPNPLTAPAEGIPPRLSARDKIVLYVGRLHPEKGVHLLVHAFAHLAGDKEEGWRLVVVGPAEAKFGGGGEPYLQQLKEAAANAGDRIEFRGAIFDDAALMQEYRRARLFVYPSLAETGESFGLAPLEAMAHGCAVLVSGLSCFHDFIQDGATGFSFDHRAPVPEDALRDRLRALMRDEALLEHVSAAGREVAAGFSITRVADQFLADFDAVVRARG